MLTKLPSTSTLTATPRNTHICRYTDPQVPFWLHMDSKYSRLYLLTEELMKENRTNPEVVMTEEKREGGATRG